MNDPREPVAVDAEELRALLHLRALPGIGDRTLDALLERFGGARRVPADPTVLGERAAAAYGEPAVAGRVERALETIGRLGIAVLPRGHAGYPAELLHLHDPPAVVFARGRLELLDRPTVAVVGSRRPSPDGARAAEILASELSRAGVVVVSGMARGIDGIAHAAAVAGGTVGVLGCGIDVAYPREQAALHERVAREGLLLSEFLPGEPPMPHHFPRRNRIIAALSLGVLVVEASAKSGALITVDHALDLGREVYAVPGPIVRPTSAGTNRLISEGAKLVMRAADVLEDLGLRAAAVPEAAAEAESRDPPPPSGISGDGRALWDALEYEPRHLDALAEDCGLRTADALVALLDLELQGHVRQLPGKRFARA